jgi:hypothetical protein
MTAPNVEEEPVPGHGSRDAVLEIIEKFAEECRHAAVGEPDFWSATGVARIRLSTTPHAVERDQCTGLDQFFAVV